MSDARTPTALVIGAGMVGVSTALALQARRIAVTLVDAKAPGSETSFGNAGILSRGSVLPPNTPSLWRALPGYLFNRSAAVRVDRGHLARHPVWALRVLANARPAQTAAASRALNALTATAVSRHKALMVEAGIPQRLRETGWLKLFERAESYAAFAAECAAYDRFGIGYERLEPPEIAALEPHLAPRFAHGVLITDTASVDNPGAVTQAYARLFSDRGGSLLTGRVGSLGHDGRPFAQLDDGTRLDADNVVIALGPWSNDLVATLGLRLPLGFERGYHRVFATRGNIGLNRPIYHAEGGYVLTPMEGGLRLTSGVEITARDAPSNISQLDRAEKTARGLLDFAAAHPGSDWRGARPSLPDGLPVIGPAPGFPHLWLAFGHGHIGFSTGPVTGALIADLITGRRPVIDPAPYSATRF